MGAIAILAGLIAVVIGGGLAVRSAGRGGVARRLAAVERVDIAAVTDGEVVKIAGEIAALEELTAPLSGRTCVWYEAVLTHPAGVIGRDVASVRCEVIDDSGRAIVELEGARIEVGVEAIHARPDLVSAMLRHHGICAVPTVVACSEAILAPGDMVEILGTAAREPDPLGQAGPGYRSAPTRVHLRPGAAPLVVAMVRRVEVP
jgi:hypothetical protein